MKKEKKHFIFIVVTIIILYFIFNIINYLPPKDLFYTTYINHIGNTLIPRSNPLIILTDLNNNTIKFTLIGGFENGKNEISEESFILDSKTKKLSGQKIKNIKSYFDNNNNYFLTDKTNYDNKNKIVVIKLPEKNKTISYGVEIYDFKTGKIQILKSKPTLTQEEVGDCIEVIGSKLFIISGINASSNNTRVEIIDLEKDNMINIPIDYKCGGVMYFNEWKKYALIGGLNRKTNQPLTNIRIINFDKKQILPVADLQYAQIHPITFHVSWSGYPGQYFSVDTKKINNKNVMESITQYLYFQNNDFKDVDFEVMEPKFLSLNKFKLQYFGSNPNNNNEYLYFIYKNRKNNYYIMEASGLVLNAISKFNYNSEIESYKICADNLWLLLNKKNEKNNNINLMFLERNK